MPGAGNADRPGDPVILQLPPADGAVGGMDEQFRVDPYTGTCTLRVPLLTSRGRGSLTPALTLVHGGGNGVFGLGWQLTLPSVSRTTARRLPRYLDAEDSDVFSLGTELVPALVQAGGSWVPDLREDRLSGETYHVRRHRPRVETERARIERWQNVDTGETHWRSISAENITHVFGRTPAARLEATDGSGRVFEWLLEESFDDRGNLVAYEYQREDTAGVDRDAPAERYRLDRPHARRHLKRICYGNEVPGKAGDWLFQVVLDYGDHDREDPGVAPSRPWTTRADPFSTFRAGFELRTYRLCRRLLVFHRFDELGVGFQRIGATELEYDESPAASLLRSIARSGRRKEGAAAERDSLPPLELEYTEARIDGTVRALDEESLQGLPGGVDGACQWVDLDGEGLAGILSSRAGGWFYKRNLGQGRFAPSVMLPAQPPASRTAPRLSSLEGDGQIDLIDFSGGSPGYYARSDEGGWEPFRPFQSLPDVPLHDTRLRFLDLDADGRADLLYDGEGHFRVYPSLGREGFGAPVQVSRPIDEEAGPAVSFASGEIFLADMTGDGLTDIVRIRNGEVCYWPNLGHGHFGAKVTMDGSPCFDHPEQFRLDRVRLANLDGNGGADLLYLGRNEVRFWINQSGNGFGSPQRIAGFPAVDEVSTVAVTDLLGNGTACLVWSSPLPGEGARPVQFVDLFGGVRPHLLRSFRNNFGEETTVEYTASTRDYLADALEGDDWACRLPSPPAVVDRVDRVDRTTGARSTVQYRYHHGYYDRAEREQRGFAVVEQRLEESCSADHGRGLFDPEAAALAARPPPALSRTWFDVGAWRQRDAIHAAAAERCYTGDPRQILLGDAVLADHLTAGEQQEALRAASGQVRREETFGLDGSPQEPHPYLVKQRRTELRPLQPAGVRQHGAFFAHACEAVEGAYERKADDPRIAHHVTLAIDDLGNVLRAAEIDYPRRQPERPEQARILARLTENDVENQVQEPGRHRVGVPVASRRYELTGLTPAPALLDRGVLASAAASAEEIPFERQPAEGRAQKRLFEHTRRLYWADDLSALLPLGQIGALALAAEEQRLALTPGLAQALYGTRVADPAVSGGYAADPDGFWVRANRTVFDPSRFHQPVKWIDPFGGERRAQYDRYALLPIQTVDPVGNAVAVVNDYSCLLPAFLTDENGNQSAVRFDALGRVRAFAAMGKPGGLEGDTLLDPTASVEYQLSSFAQSGTPASVSITQRERHRDPGSGRIRSITYLGGRAQELQRKSQAEPGAAPARGPDGQLLADRAADTGSALRWIGAGIDVKGSRGSSLKRYDPYFTDRPDFEPEANLRAVGTTALRRYDPLGRLVREDLPDGSFRLTEYGPWSTTSWDANDTVLKSAWYSARQAPGTDPVEQRAARRAAAHAGTPTVAVLDPAGRQCAHVADAGSGQRLETNEVLDIQGNSIAVIDALGRRAREQSFDLLRRVVAVQSIDAGERSRFVDVLDQPVLEWNRPGQTVLREYDALRRPTRLSVTEQGRTRLAECAFYGERAPQAQELNLRGRLHMQFDAARAVLCRAYDFQGRLVQSDRRLTRDHRDQTDWAALSSLEAPDAIERAAGALLEAGGFETLSQFDAMGRPTSTTAPDRTTLAYRYQRTGLLAGIAGSLRGAPGPAALLDGIEYDPRGERLALSRPGGVRTTYRYDPLSLRLVGLTTTAGDVRLQDLNHAYDPAGNVLSIDDRAQQSVFFDNAEVDAGADYVYDPLYQLIEARGREHAGATGDRQPDDLDVLTSKIPAPGDRQALRRYAERYEYDATGNLLAMTHRPDGASSAAPTWTRRYAYDSEPGRRSSNRLLSTSAAGDETAPYSCRYEYDANGNMTRMPHLAAIGWSYQDRLSSADLGGGGTISYAYDTSGRRARKVVERVGGGIQERLYVTDGFEVYRERRGEQVALARETLHVVVGGRRLLQIDTLTVEGGEPVAQPDPLLRQQIDDRQGSACLELDGEGGVISYEEYAPYGTSTYRAAAGLLSSSAKRYRYTGRERDEDTSLQECGARWYIPWLGRWASCDPAGMVDGPNPYQYVRSNPTTHVDPKGTQIESPPGSACKAEDDACRLNAEEQARKAQVSAGAMVQGGLTMASAPDSKPIPVFLGVLYYHRDQAATPAAETTRPISREKLDVALKHLSQSISTRQHLWLYEQALKERDRHLDPSTSTSDQQQIYRLRHTPLGRAAAEFAEQFPEGRCVQSPLYDGHQQEAFRDLFKAMDLWPTEETLAKAKDLGVRAAQEEAARPQAGKYQPTVLEVAQSANAISQGYGMGALTFSLKRMLGYSFEDSMSSAERMAGAESMAMTLASKTAAATQGAPRSATGARTAPQASGLTGGYQWGAPGEAPVRTIAGAKPTTIKNEYVRPDLDLSTSLSTSDQWKRWRTVSGFTDSLHSLHEDGHRLLNVEAWRFQKSLQQYLGHKSITTSVSVSGVNGRLTALANASSEEAYRLLAKNPWLLPPFMTLGGPPLIVDRTLHPTLGHLEIADPNTLQRLLPPFNGGAPVGVMVGTWGASCEGKETSCTPRWQANEFPLVWHTNVRGWNVMHP